MTRMRYKVGGYLAAKILNFWFARVRWSVAYRSIPIDPAIHENVAPAIYIFWHEYIPALYHLRPNSGVSVLLSQHRDAELLTQASLCNGFGVIRGSSTRGGVTAVKKLVQSNSAFSLGITPDGPKGPRRKVKSGCVYLSSRLQIPIVPLGIAYENPWRIRRAWDQFAMPKPWSRGRIVFGSPIEIAADIGKDEIETTRAYVEQSMLDVGDAAEDALSGKNTTDEFFKTRQMDKIS